MNWQPLTWILRYPLFHETSIFHATATKFVYDKGETMQCLLKGMPLDFKKIRAKYEIATNPVSILGGWGAQCKRNGKNIKIRGKKLPDGRPHRVKDVCSSYRQRRWICAEHKLCLCTDRDSHGAKTDHLLA